MPLASVRRAAAVVAIAAVAASCTAPPPQEEPTASPSATPESRGTAVEAAGDRVAVIIASSDTVAAAEAAALERAAEELAGRPPAGVVEVQVERAASSDFTRDLADLAVDDGFDLVCVVGTGAAELVLELARARRDARFCTTDGRIAGGPVNLVAVAIDPVALVEAGAVAIGTATAPVGLLLGAQLGDTDALTTAFTSAVAPPRQPALPTPSPAPSPTAGATSSPSPSQSPSPGPAVPGPTSPQPPFVTATPGSGDAVQEGAAEELVAQQPSRSLLLVTPGGTDVATVVGASGSELVVVSDWAVDPEGELPPNLLVALTVDWAALLAGAVEAGLSDDAPQVQLLGVAEGVLDALPGQAPEAEAAAQRTTEHLRRSTE